MANTMQIPVIFRAQKERGQLWVTAVFPIELGTYDPGTFTVYQHIGQHGSGTIEWYRRTRPATPAEYADLLNELRGIYGTSICDGDPIVDLLVTQRMTRRHFRARLQQARDITKG
jgi:hypothetical protein